MTQITWRASEELADRVKRAAAQQGRSVNEFLTRVLDAATNPDLADDERQRTRERLARAGLLLETRPLDREPPDPEELARAGRAAAQGTSLSDLVSEGRGPK
jgi:uncharacterized protein (DUF1778 family)